MESWWAIGIGAVLLLTEVVASGLSLIALFVPVLVVVGLLVVLAALGWLVWRRLARRRRVAGSTRR